MTHRAPTAVAEPLLTQVEFVSDAVTIRACLARPAVSTPAPAIVILHEWWGLNAHVEEIATRFAREGYVAMAPNLYSRAGYTVATDPNEAAALMNALSSQAVLRDLNAAARFVSAQPFVDPQRLGLIGFGMGGTFTLTQATHNSAFKAAIAFYGKVPPLETLNRLLCPVLYHYGAKDAWVTRQEVDRLKEGLTKYNKPGEVCIYEEANHAFFNDTRPDVYRAVEAHEAWRRTLAFMSRHLR